MRDHTFLCCFKSLKKLAFHPNVSFFLIRSEFAEKGKEFAKESVFPASFHKIIQKFESGFRQNENFTAPFNTCISCFSHLFFLSDQQYLASISQ